MSKFAVRLSNQIIWTEGGREILFDTEEMALTALGEEMVLCEEAFADGYMEDAGDFDDYRIVEINE
jgi:hypothetical protein